jgi:hypothetical protein
MAESGLKFDKCVEFALQGIAVPKIKTVALEAVVGAFGFNVKQTLGMILAPAVVGYIASDLQRTLDQGELRIAGNISGPPPRLTMEMMDHAKKSQIEDLRRNASLSHEEQMGQVSIAFGRSLNFIDIAAAHPRGREGFDAMLASLLVGSWTAIETMAADLWEAALNDHPVQLAELVGEIREFKRGDKAKPSASKPTLEKENRKTVLLDLIKENDYEVRKKMGTILRRRYHFSRLYEARVAYGAAFGEGAKDIKRSIMDYSLDALSAIRNVQVHNSGVIDAEYLERKVYLKDRIPSGEIGQRLSLDGVVAIGFIKPALATASSLIAAVDGWLAANKPPQ